MHGGVKFQQSQLLPIIQSHRQHEHEEGHLETHRRQALSPSPSSANGQNRYVYFVVMLRQIDVFTTIKWQISWSR